MTLLRSIYQWLKAIGTGIAVAFGFSMNIPSDVVRKKQ